jgi:hypothetical protein
VIVISMAILLKMSPVVYLLLDRVSEVLHATGVVVVIRNRNKQVPYQSLMHARRRSYVALTFRNAPQELIQHLDMTGNLLPSPFLTGLMVYPLCDQFVAAVRFAILGLLSSPHGFDCHQCCQRSVVGQ